MCMGTLVIGGIRSVVIAAKDARGGAMGLIEQSEYLKEEYCSQVDATENMVTFSVLFKCLKRYCFIPIVKSWSG